MSASEEGDDDIEQGGGETASLVAPHEKFVLNEIYEKEFALKDSLDVSVRERQ